MEEEEVEILGIAGDGNRQRGSLRGAIKLGRSGRVLSRFGYYPNRVSKV